MLKNVFAGALMGIANIIPGISGGTLAVILGIYDRIIHCLNQLSKAPFKHKDAAFFLAQVGLGAIIAIKASAGLIDTLIQIHPHPTFFFFIGLIIGSVPVIYKNHNNMGLTPQKAIAFILPFALVTSLALLSGSEDSIPSGILMLDLEMALFLFISGTIAAATMIIPGISGSFILLLMGSYQLILQSVATVNLPVIAIVGCGAIIGLISVTKAIDYCLQKHPAFTHYAILGLLIGSIVKLWPGALIANMEGAISLSVAILGFFAAKKLGK